MYYAGQGVDPNVKETFQWYKESALKGKCCYCSKKSWSNVYPWRGVKKDIKEAKKYGFKKAMRMAKKR